MGGRRLVAARNQLLDRQIGCVGEQKAGFEADIVYAGRGERGRGVAQERVVGRCKTGGQAASSASRPASSSAVSASINSSSPA
jgi:hypothetical protein